MRDAKAPVVVDRIALALPAQRFRVCATVSRDARVPLVTEFVLRLLSVLDDVSVASLRVFFGFTQEEVVALLTDLVRENLIVEHGGVVSLTSQGRALFRYGDKDHPQIVESSEVDQVIPFERVTFSPLEASLYRARVPRAVPTFEIKDRNRAERPSKAVGAGFQQYFREIAREFLSPPGSYEKAYVYSVNNVQPKRNYRHELYVPVEFDSATGAARANILAAFGSNMFVPRNELTALISEYVRSVNPAIESAEALDFVSEFDEGVLTRFRSGPYAATVDPDAWILNCAQRSDGQRETESVYGSTAMSNIQDLLLERMDDRRFRDVAVVERMPILWVRPSLPYWGRSSSFYGLARELGRERGVYLLSGEDPTFSVEELRRCFGGGKRRKQNGEAKRVDVPLFAACVTLRRGVLPAALEMIISPGRGIFVLVYSKQDEESLPLPVGFYTEQLDVVRAAGKALSSRVVPLSATASLTWGHEDLDDKASTEVIERALRELL